MNIKSKLLIGLASSAALLASVGSWADGYSHSRFKNYEVTITNLTPGQPIAPLLVVTHKAGLSFFSAGEAPTEGLDALAEAGNGMPLAEMLETMSGVRDVELGDAGTPPGGSSSVTVLGRPGDHFSIGAMLGNTNDAFVGLADVALPFGWNTRTVMAPAYDAGTETNDESCATVPGPACGGEAMSPYDDGEGFVTIHNGIHGIGGLDAALYDWRNPVAKIEIRRVH